MHQDFMKTRVESVREGFFLTTTVHVTLMRQMMGQGGEGAACHLALLFY